MNEKQVSYLKQVANQMRESVYLLDDITGQQGNSYAMSRNALVVKVIRMNIEVLAKLQEYERRYSPHSKIVGIDFPTKDGVQFERMYPDEPF